MRKKKPRQRTERHCLPQPKDCSFLPLKKVLTVNKRRILHGDIRLLMKSHLGQINIISRESFSSHFFLTENIVKLNAFEASL